MTNPLARRTFLAAGTATLAAAAAGAASAARDQPAAPGKTPNGFKNAVKYYMVEPGKTLLEKFQLLKDLGFDGVELDAPRHDPREVLAARAKTGLEVPGLVDSVHWNDPLSSPSAATRARGLAALQK